MGRSITEVTQNMSDRLFDENKMYTYLKGYLSGKEMYQSMKLLPYVKEKHKGQDRRGKDQVPYFSHPLQLASHAIALGIQDDTVVSAALLHDVCEDCNVAVEDLPVDRETKEAVALLTKTNFPERPYQATDEQMKIYKNEKRQAEESYYERIRGNRTAVIIKLLDRCHNLSGMACAWTPEKMAEYILDTEEYIYPLMEYAKNTYPEYYSQLYLIKYHMRSVVETIRHILPVLNT
ncbi:MAG: HD domain-containing protein [Blautia sp.]|nr:HD domain-containing protein [Blautia sp.]